MSITTIQLDTATRQALSRLKAGDTYDGLLRKLLRLVPEGDDEGLFSDAFRVGLLEARLDVQDNRLMTTSELEKQLGL